MQGPEISSSSNLVLGQWVLHPFQPRANELNPTSRGVEHAVLSVIMFARWECALMRVESCLG